ncbi:ATP-binding protein [Bradyrhizobium stylosanthis]|uniref:ATP-binding protein n=1 Tax=Bradyrhizobium stylosanthis TaxID=1803665 RepID=UPI0007C45C87|nr:ATP-binding protein [Bradyrhizobium stylosanthis]
MRQPKEDDWHFDVSTGLKNVLGSELITDDEVAIFELVKNSFDASASRVDLFFGIDQIIVSDNGTGMSYDDIRNKWLFVAYSSKRQRNSDDFREEIAERRHYAGSKGIGRFSSDRLGQLIRLQTRPSMDSGGMVHSLRIDWSNFDRDHREHFEDVELNYSELGSFEVPLSLPKLKHGTVITIEQLRREWDREKLLRLKSALSKLINPFGASTDGFRIFLSAPAEAKEDARLKDEAKKKPEEELPSNAIVNGAIGNFIFTTLREKTTYLSVRISKDGAHIESVLTDRGELIYRIREPNNYALLAKSGFRCEIYFLNTSAKLTFARRMGVPSIRFGSVFLFRNGFRVFPVGEFSDDWFGMDARKLQGFSRFLGTRDIIGRIDVSGSDTHFQEASSRNTGLIETPAVVQLKEFFVEQCLKRLERYVVPVTFPDLEDRKTSDITRLMTEPGRARVAAAVAKLTDSDAIELLEYSTKLIGILSERSSQFEGSLVSLRAIAEKTNDRNLLDEVDGAAKRYQELKRSEEVARKQADDERKAKEAAEARATRAEAVASKVSVELDEEKKRNLFLASIATLDADNLLSMHHQVTQYAVAVQQAIENFLVRVAEQSSVDVADAVNTMDRISLLNKKILGVAKFATKANFRLESERIEADLAEYVEQYVNDVARDFLHGPMTIKVTNDGKGLPQRFKPIDVSVVIDNLIANSRKAKASEITIEISHPDKKSVYIRFLDNGRGFDPRFDDLERVFEKGFTTTDGSGLGLYHVRHVLGEMNGTIEAHRLSAARGAEFLIRVSR